MDKVPTITYGKVPPGFIQKIPIDGSPRTRIVAGEQWANSNTGVKVTLGNCSTANLNAQSPFDSN